MVCSRVYCRKVTILLSRVIQELINRKTETEAVAAMHIRNSLYYTLSLLQIFIWNKLHERSDITLSIEFICTILECVSNVEIYHHYI